MQSTSQHVNYVIPVLTGLFGLLSALAGAERLASDVVATLRSHAGRNPYDRVLQDLIGELSTRSDEFRVRWAAHNVRFHRTGRQAPAPPDRRRASAQLRDDDDRCDDGLSMALYATEPGSASQQAPDLLASWTAAPEVRETPPDGGVRPQ
jgi:hypothetical protein